MAREEEIDFNESKKKFEQYHQQIKAAIKAYDDDWLSLESVRAGINSEQYERLKETLQEIEKNIPARETINFQKRSNVAGELPTTVPTKSFFSNILNFFKRIIMRNQISEKNTETVLPENTEQPIEENEEDKTQKNIVYNAEELIENARNAHTEFIEASARLDELYESLLDEQPQGKIINEERGGPGILDDYRQSSWGIERICLDGFQNHLPEDSKGTKCYLHFLVDNQWVDRETAIQAREKIQKVRFSDNGVGFTSDNLFYLHSTKTSEDTSAGQFGEGMKLASIAAVNLGLGIEFQSRNWRAIAGSEEKKIINTRYDDKEEVRRRLIYDVTTYSGEPIQGSRTIFHTPTPEFIDYALQLPEKVIELGKIESEFSKENCEIIDTEKGGEAFVKGIFLTRLDSFFSYNFNNANVNPDRNGFHNFEPKTEIGWTISELRDVEIIKKLIKRIHQYSEEKELYNKSSSYLWKDDCPKELGATSFLDSGIKYASKEAIEAISSVWQKAFEEAFSEIVETEDGLVEKKAILRTDYDIPEHLKETLEDYVLVRLPQNWISTLRELGVKADEDIIPEYVEEKLPTSITLNYGNTIWDSQRIVLDACQNHLPSDSRGNNIFLRFQTSDGKWHDYREFEKFEDSEILKIKIADDGVGYDYKHLGIFASVKEHEASSGKWGEGLKMLSAAAVRNGIQMELRSRDWIAIPETQTEVLNEGKPNEQKVERLIFKTRRKVEKKSKVLDDQDNPSQPDYGYSKENEKSSTTFVNPTPKLIQEFRKIRENVLTFNPRTPITTVNENEVLDTFAGQLYIRNILIPGNHQLKYSYHLKNFDIETRDRNIIKRESMQEALRNIFENVEDERFIGEFLSNAFSQAQEYNEERFLEFETPFKIPNDTELADKWITVFKRKFGENTTLRRSGDLDADAYHQAQHMGLDMITLPDTVAVALIDLRGKSGQTITSYKEELNGAIKNAVIIDEENLTDEEKRRIDHLYKYNEILKLKSFREEPIKQIKVFDYPETYLGKRAAGFASYGDTININRKVLNGDIIDMGDVFFHESVHALTGAGDAAPMFRDYLSSLLGGIAARLLPIEESIDDNGVAQGISKSDITLALSKLGQMLQTNIDKDKTGEELEDI